ncbi:MAG TPA: hypothetical protein VES79_14025, partial [Solirubrobacteraceae bacterium]|nr:hypothetical protein [Solirubrobacteraceae bacterium]
MRRSLSHVLPVICGESEAVEIHDSCRARARPQEVSKVRMLTGRFRPSPSMVVAFLAMTVALGGTSYAVTTLPSKSVGSKQLRSKAVGTANIKNKAVTGAKVKDDSLTGTDINEGSLGQVPSAAAAGNATRAATAGNADHANAAAALDRVSYRSQTATVDGATLE